MPSRYTISRMNRAFSLVAPLLLLAAVPQFKIPKPTIGDVAKAAGADAIFKKGPAITTNIKDAKWAKDYSGTSEGRRSLMELQRTPNGGFVLQPGSYAMTVQSYCMHAGSHGPSSGDGYIFAPVLGPFHDYVTTVARNSVNHPEIPQRDVQVLIWALIARTKTSDLQGGAKSAAEKLLTRKQRYDIDGGALGVLSDDRFAQAFGGQPPLLRQIYEAEARLRQMLTSSGTTFEQMERVAVLAGEAPLGPGSCEVPSGRWSQHPDGYWVRYFPSGYSTTKIELDVPQGSPAVGKEFDPATQVATPGNTARQRLLQSARPKDLD